MKKFLGTLTGIVITVIVVAIIVIFLGWSRLPDMLASKLSKKMKVPVEIEAIKLSSDSIRIDKLEIGNPRGCILPKAFSSQTININAPLSRYLSKQIVIDEILIDTIYLGIEFLSQGSKQGNWTTIMGNFKASEKPTAPGHGKSVLIKRLILTNINVDLAYTQNRQPVKHLPYINRLEFTDVTSEEGIPSEQISNVILQQALRSIFQRENIQNMIEDLLTNPPRNAQDLLAPLRKLIP